MSIPVEAELGCGQEKPVGRFGVDRINTDKVDLVQDLDKEDWDLPSNHFEFIRARDLFEHLDNPINFVEEVYRILEDGGVFEVQAPHISSNNWIDPTHKRLVGVNTFDKYFSEDGNYSYYSSARFEVLCKKIIFNPKRKLFFWNKLLEKIVNYSEFMQFFFERSLLSRIFPAQNVEVVLKKRGENK